VLLILSDNKILSYNTQIANRVLYSSRNWNILFTSTNKKKLYAWNVWIKTSFTQSKLTLRKWMILTRVNTSFEWRKFPSLIWLSTCSFPYYAKKADSTELRKLIKAYVHCTELHRTETERIELWVSGAYQKKRFWTTSNRARFLMVVRHNTHGRRVAEYCRMSYEQFVHLSI